MLRFLSFQELNIFGQTPEWQRQVKVPVGGAWASPMLANTSLALPLPAACILFIPQQRERWQSVSEEQPFVIPTAAPFPVSATDTKIITVIRIMQLIDSLSCDHAAADLAIAWLLHLVPCDFLRGRMPLKYLRTFRIHSPGCSSQRLTPFWCFFYVC